MSDIFEYVDKNNSTAELIIDKNQIKQCYITDDLTKNFPKIPKFGKGGICNGANFAFSQIDEIVKDIRDRQDNAMAMEFTKCIGELLRKNGVLPKITEYTRENVKESSIEKLYGVSIDELDFTEHDKVFEDKIADLEKRIRELIKEKDEYKRKCNDFGFENQELKQRISGLESKEKSDLPFDPLECANYLINATYERETNGIERTFHNLPDKVNSDRYTVDDLEQIAEHLLVYCKHNKESE